METTNKEKIDDNKAANLIKDMNIELKIFLDKFMTFRKEYNITDINLCDNLELVYNEISNFINGEPKAYKTEKRTNIELKFLRDNGIARVYVCDKCQLEIGEKVREVWGHIESHSTKNTINKVNVAKESSSVNGIVDKRTESNKKAKKKKVDSAYIDKPLPKKAYNFINGDFGKFLDDATKLSKKLLTIPEYKLIEQNLKEILSPQFPDVKLFFFGSRINGLSNSNSDLDIFVDIGNSFHVYDDDKQSIINKINKVEKLLRKSSMWKYFQPVKNARVPILKAYYFNEKMQIECDFSFSHGLGRSNTMLIKYFFDLQPICQKLCTFLKEWLKKTTLFENITTYTYVLLTVFFLQTKKILPPVKQVQEGIENPLLIGPWQADFIVKSIQDLNLVTIDSSNQNCYKLLIEFFKYYYNFQFEKFVVCPFLGIPVLKQSFLNKINEIPRYSAYCLKNTQNSLQIQKPICVMDPLELNHNVAKGLSEKNLTLMRRFWRITYEELENQTKEEKK